ncbi:MOD1 [Symbiodinium sp. CCMP2592]|nr:MOD1 [Symbiodinium sp. CCMP2592]
MFAPLIPGNTRTYIYNTEYAYYTQYSKGLFGITMRKMGWDCFRHYEIIMSGSIPFFIGLEDMPNRTMTSFPRALVASAMALPGVPSQAEVKESMAKGQVPQVNLEQFDMKAYMTLRNQLMEYAAQNLLTTSTASKVVPQKVMQKVLVHSRAPEVGYGQFVLVNGLVNNGHSVCARPEGMLDTMRDDYAGALDTAYGGGFSYARTVDHTKLGRDCHGPWDYYLLLAEDGDDYPEPNSEDAEQAKNIFAINFDDKIQASLRAPAVATEYFVREL